MNGYAVQLRLRRAGAGAVTERAFAVSDAAVARLRRGVLWALGAALFLLAPLAMAALTMPESGRLERIAYDFPVGAPFE